MPELSVDEFLAHHGVKGMKWGVHEEKSTAETSADLKRSLDKVHAKLDKKSGSHVVAGYGLKGWAGAKQYDKAIKRDPSFEYKKLSPEARRAYDKKSYRIATRSVVTRGAAETALILAGGNLASQHVQTKNVVLAKKVTLLILATNGAMRISQLNSLHQAKTVEGLHYKQSEIQRHLDLIAKENRKSAKLKTKSG